MACCTWASHTKKEMRADHVYGVYWILSRFFPVMSLRCAVNFVVCGLAGHYSARRFASGEHVICY